LGDFDVDRTKLIFARYKQNE